MTIMLIGMCAAAVVWGSQQAMAAARTALSAFANGVLPALYPMMVLTSLLPAGGSGTLTAIFSFLSGSPASAKRVAASGSRYPETMLALCGVMSPMFFTGTLTIWTGNPSAAGKMLLLHWLGAIITATFWRMMEKPSVSMDFAEQEKITLPQAISQSAAAVMGVCGAMMLFSIAAAILRMVLPLGEPVLSVLHALLEIGSGVHGVLDAWKEPPYALLCGLCAFGGVSIWLQNLLFLPKSIRPAKLLCMRALHGAVCYGLGLISFP